MEEKILPYLRDIYKDLYSKDIYETPGLNKLIFKEYAQLPGFIEDRFLATLDKDGDGFINEKEFLTGMTKVFTGNLE